MLVTLEEMKNYLRVDYDDDDNLIETLIASAQSICMDILRVDDNTLLFEIENAKPAVMYSVAYLYEHREEADHHALTITLRSLLFGSRKEVF
ncbi:MAG: head-tail connector protein [Anaerostipes sp.]|uniref:head-tail connector protein n=1 Tax=Anaerostipes sp. TaxID=1872530 RepID=UPI0039945574